MDQFFPHKIQVVDLIQILQHPHLALVIKSIQPLSFLKLLKRRIQRYTIWKFLQVLFQE